MQAVEKKENTNERWRSSYHDEYATVEREEAVERKDKYAVRFMNPSTTMDRSQNYALHFICITFHLHCIKKNLPRQHEMHAMSQFKCHALHLHFMK